MHLKTIPPRRDRLQSRALVCVIVPLILIHAVRVAAAILVAPATYGYVAIAVAISIFFGLFAWLLKAATPAAAACGGIICFLLTISTPNPPAKALHSGLPPLILLFLFTFFATRYGRAGKEARSVAEARSGRRVSQVIANLGIAALCASIHVCPLAFAAAVAALAEATADTLSSEIGQAIGGPAYLLTTLGVVPAGTDGGISVAGTVAGMIGACIVCLAGLRHPFSEVAAIFVGAVAGLFFDSLLGATLERKGWIGNDLVNFSSTAFAAAVAGAILALSR